MRFFALVFCIAPLALAASPEGIEIVPDEGGTFTYTDDFSTPRVLQEAFVGSADVTVWTEGALQNVGPHTATVIYRFVGERAIQQAEVKVEQSANGRNLGGLNVLYVSQNGLDWEKVSESGTQEPDANGWQREPLVFAADQGTGLLGGRAFWVKLLLRNYSGLKTSVSNSVDAIEVNVRLAEEGSPSAGKTGLEGRADWSRLQAAGAWRPIVLDSLSAPGTRPPHFFEDTDGWLAAADASRLLVEGDDGFCMGRVYREGERIPLSLALYVETRSSESLAMARIRVRCGRESSRCVAVLWQGEEVAEFDTGQFFEAEQDFFVHLPGPFSAGTGELRIVPRDTGNTVLVKRVELVGDGVVGWAERAPLPQSDGLEIVSAYFMPDLEPPAASQAVEGRQQTNGINMPAMQMLYKEHGDFGAVRVVYRNSGTETVRLRNTVELNGRPVEESYVDFAESVWDAPGVVWYRIHPRTLLPGECGQAYVRFRRRPDGDGVAVRLTPENGTPVGLTIPYGPLPARVDYVTTANDGHTLYVYTRRDAGEGALRLTGITLDGEPQPEAALYGTDFPGSVGLGVVELAEPLSEGTYHVAGLELSDGRHIAAQFRVLPALFPRSSIHVPAELAKPMHMNLLTWRMHDEETCREVGLPTSCMHRDVFNLHALSPFIFAPDEPDAKDNRGGGYDRGLGWHARVLEESGWFDLVARHEPASFSWMNMDGTVRPLNWAVYGQYGDVNGFDPYPVTYYDADHAYVRESLSYVRSCCAPTRMYAILEAYGWARGQGVPAKVRGPLPGEYRQNVVQAIGAGMKGLTSWVHSSGAGGWALDDTFAEEIGKVNELIERVEDYLLLGTPVDLVVTDAGLTPTGSADNEQWDKERVWAGSLLCGPHAIVVAVANHIPATRTDPPKIEPARDVTVSVDLPPYMEAVEAFEVTEDGVSPLATTAEAGTVRMVLDEVATGRVFLLKQAPGASAK